MKYRILGPRSALRGRHFGILAALARSHWIGAASDVHRLDLIGCLAALVMANEAGADAQAHADTHALANEGCHEVPNAKAVAGADVVPLAEARGGDRCAVGRDRRQRR